MLSYKTRQHIKNLALRRTASRELMVNILLKIKRRGGGSESNPRKILLRGSLKFFRALGGRAYADKKNAGREGIQSPGVTDLQVLLPKMPYGQILDLTYNIG